MGDHRGRCEGRTLTLSDLRHRAQAAEGFTIAQTVLPLVPLLCDVAEAAERAVTTGGLLVQGKTPRNSQAETLILTLHRLGRALEAAP